MKNYVTICGFPRWAFLCLASLFAFKVVAEYGSNDRAILQSIQTDTGDMSFSIDDIADILSADGDYTISEDFQDYHYVNTDFATCYNIIKSQLAFNQYNTFSNPQDFSTRRQIVTLLGLVRGFDMLPQFVNDGIPNGANTNGIWYFTRDLSDSLHNTNSVFHRQLTAQETLTNQMERLITMQTNMLQYISYQLAAPVMNDGFNYFGSYADYLNDYDRYYSGYPFMLVNQSWPFLDTIAYTEEENGYDSRAQVLMDVWGALNNEDLGGIMEDLSLFRYERYGTKWGFDVITNQLEDIFNTGFSISDVDLVKNDVEDIIQDSTEDAESSLPPQNEKQDDRRPGNYEPVDDERIDTHFVIDASGQKENFFLNKDLFNTFKTSYRSRFNSSGSNKLAYEFSFDAPEDDLTVSEADIMNGVDISSHKSDINSFLRVMVGLLRFICIIILFGKAFKMVSEVFST